jgi:hypothetical protein
MQIYNFCWKECSKRISFIKAGFLGSRVAMVVSLEIQFPEKYYRQLDENPCSIV